MTFRSKKRVAINRANRYFNKLFGEQKAERIFNTMELIGIDNRGVAMDLAFEAFNEKYGKPLN